MTNDIFGIEQKYNTKSNGDEWFMDMNNFDDDNRIEIDCEDISVENNGSYWNGTPDTSMNPDSFRVNIYTRAGNQTATRDHSLAAQRGYMATPGDWRNVEMTGYFRINSTRNMSEEITLYARGGEHTSRGDRTNRCRGTAYKPGIQYDGKPNFVKEYWHNTGDWQNNDDSFKNKPGGPGRIVDKWIGIKSCVYDIKENGEDRVKIEMYFDLVDNNDFSTPSNNWTHYYTLIDKGNNMGRINNEWVERCNARDRSEIFTWGGPVVTFRIDEAQSIDLKWLSVREIQPPQ